MVFVACGLLGTSAAWHAHRRAEALREQIKALRTGQMTPEDEAALTEERDRARAETQRIAAEAVELRAASADLLKLRGEVTLLRREARGDGESVGGGVADGQGAIFERSRVDETDTLISINTDRYFQQCPPRVIEGTGGTKVTSEVRAVSLAKKGQPKSQP